MIRSRSLKKFDDFHTVDDAESLSSRHRPRHSRRTMFLVLVSLALILVLALETTIARQSVSLLSRMHTRKPALLIPLRTKPPLVDRKILEKLASLDESDFEISVMRPWPPRVTRIPEPQVQPVQHILDLPAPAFDAQFCPNANCKFLFPLWMGEQESKARLHILQLLSLARSLNRTLVLPNVAKSRMGACLKWDFGLYYDKQQFLTEEGVISMEKFKSWVEGREQRPIGQLVSFNWTKTPHNLEGLELHASRRELELYIHHNLVDLSTQYKRAACLPSKLPRLDISETFSPISIMFTKHAQKDFEDGSLARVVIEVLADDHNLFAAHHDSAIWDIDFEFHGEDDAYYDEDAIADLLEHTTDTLPHVTTTPSPDVMLVTWDLRHPVFSSPDLTLNYSPGLQALTTRLANNISPYIAVHWRMESVDPDLLPACADNLVSTLGAVLRENEDIKNIWLATDVPLEGSSAGSGTFKQLTPKHMEALHTIQTAFQPTSGIKLTNLKEELMRMISNGFEIDHLLPPNSGQGVKEKERQALVDSGVLGILDKIVSIKGEVFVSPGIDSGCGKISSFTKQIVDSREAIFVPVQREGQTGNLEGQGSGERIGSRLRNVVTVFG